jgi:hypothetical protein
MDDELISVHSKWFPLENYMCATGPECHGTFQKIDEFEAAIESPDTSQSAREVAVKGLQVIVAGIHDEILSGPYFTDKKKRQWFYDWIRKIEEIIRRSPVAPDASEPLATTDDPDESEGPPPPLAHGDPEDLEVLMAADAPTTFEAQTSLSSNEAPMSYVKPPRLGTLSPDDVDGSLNPHVYCRNCRLEKREAKRAGKALKCMSCDPDFRYAVFHERTNNRFLGRPGFDHHRHLDNTRYRLRLLDIIEEYSKTGEDGLRVWSMFCTTCVRDTNTDACMAKCVPIHLAAKRKTKNRPVTGSDSRPAKRSAGNRPSPSQPATRSPGDVAHPPAQASVEESHCDDGCFTIDVHEFISGLENALRGEDSPDSR